MTTPESDSSVVSARDALNIASWLVYDPYAGVDEFPTEAAAVNRAIHLIDTHLDDDWDEGVEQIVVARITRRIVRRVLGVKSEMTPEAWRELTLGQAPPHVTEWWDFDLVTTDE